MKRLIVMLVAGPLTALMLSQEPQQEVATVTTPVSRTITTFVIEGFSFARTPWRMTVTYRDNLNNLYTDTHTDAEARDIMTTLNRADLSTVSLERRLFIHLMKEGKIPEVTISGQ